MHFNHNSLRLLRDFLSWLGLYILCSLRNSIGRIFREAMDLRAEVLRPSGDKSRELHSRSLHVILCLVLSELISFLFKKKKWEMAINLDRYERLREVLRRVIGRYIWRRWRNIPDLGYSTFSEVAIFFPSEESGVVFLKGHLVVF